MMIVAKFRRGSTIVLAIDVTGDMSSLTNPVAHLKKLVTGQSKPLPGTSSAGQFTITTKEATSQYPAGYYLTLTANQTKNIEPGTYHVDIAITVNGSIMIDDGIDIQIEEPSTVLP